MSSLAGAAVAYTEGVRRALQCEADQRSVMVTPTSPTSKSGAVYTAIRQRIIDGRYTPGYRLTLSTLATEFGVSPVPVREAIRWLEAEGLVDYAHNKGAQVSDIDTAGYRESMETLALLEGMVTALSAPFLSTDQLELADAFNRRMEALTDAPAFDSDAFRRLNGHFHSTLCSACPNTRMLQLMTAEAERVNIIRRPSPRFAVSWSQRSVHEHDEILTLIRSHASAKTIERAARKHKLVSLSEALA